MNVTKREDWDAAVTTTEQKLGPLDILVNNAGTSYKNKPSLTVTESEYAICFDVNVRSIFHSVAAVFPGFVERKGGVVVNISSCGASRPRQGLVWYNASKGAVSNVSHCLRDDQKANPIELTPDFLFVQASQGLALEYGPQQIRVNSICPLLCGTGL